MDDLHQRDERLPWPHGPWAMRQCSPSMPVSIGSNAAMLGVHGVVDRGQCRSAPHPWPHRRRAMRQRPVSMTSSPGCNAAMLRCHHAIERAQSGDARHSWRDPPEATPRCSTAMLKTRRLSSRDARAMISSMRMVPGFAVRDATTRETAGTGVARFSATQCRCSRLPRFRSDAQARGRVASR